MAEVPASGRDDYKGFWERLGVDDGGLPMHFPMGVNRRGQGPEGQNPHHFVCWCGAGDCPLTQTFQEARMATVLNLRIGGAQ